MENITLYIKREIVIVLLAISIVIPFPGCTDFLDKEPDDMLTIEMVFDDKRRVEEWLAGIYNLIPDPLWGFLGQKYSSMALSDDCQIPMEFGQFGWDWTLSVNQGGWNPRNTGYDLWTDTYKQIRSAYLFMEYIKPLPSQGLLEEDVQMMKAEARFLICYYYIRMLEQYGPFPLIRESIPSDTPVESLMKERTPYGEIVNWLDSELMELSSVFPEAYTVEANNKFGRPTKGVCLAVRARMLLYAASPLFNGNPDYTDVKNKSGELLFPQNYDEGKWRKAAEASKMVIDLAEKGLYNLFIKRSTDGSIDPFLSYQDLFLTSGETNKEIIFSRKSAEAAYYIMYLSPRGAGGWGGICATQNLVDQYYMRNGLSITDPASGYKEEGFTEEPIFYNTAYNLSDEDATPGLVVNKGISNMYANREPRFYISIRYNNQWIPQEGRNTEYYNGGREGRPSHDTPVCGYHPRKAINPNDNVRSWNFPFRPGILFRLGEVYLNYAEALNEYDSGNPDILKYVNLIRERAGIPPLSSSLLGNRDKLRTAIRHEKRVEMAFETSIRFNDIRRWKIMDEVFATPITGMDQWADKENFYKRTVVMQRYFDKKMYLWPINQSIIDNNPNIVQNKYW